MTYTRLFGRNKASDRRRCYFCHRGMGASKAYYSGICIRHQILISLRLFVLLASRGRFGKLLESGEMVNTTLLQLFIFAVLFVSLGQLSLIARSLLWPRIWRIIHCPWCWKDAGIADNFPPPWTSTVCLYHDRQIRAQSAARRLARQRATAADRPAISVLQGVEEMTV